MSGEWDLATDALAAPSVQQAVDEADRRTIVIDLSALQFAGVEAVKSLRHIHDRLSENGHQILVRLPAEGPVRRLFEIAGRRRETLHHL